MATQNIDIGGVLSRVFDIYRDQAGVLLGAALVIFAVEAVVTGVLIAISPVLAIVGALVALAATYFYVGMVVELVRDLQDGRRDSEVGDLFRAVAPVVLPLVGLGIVAGIAIAIGLLLLIVPGLILLTIWAVASPSLVLERHGVFRALGRSRELVRGHGWQVFAVILIVFLIQIVVSAVFGGIGAAAGTVLQIILRLVGNVLTAPLFALAATTLYLDLRQLKGEGAPAAGAAGAAASAPPAGAEQPGAPAAEPPPPPPPPAS